ncbi:hypothetical protein I552_10256 [Mycobacterium xenopi 3993]|nr:hypothetical protein I552_10256 [Mycobacterium xenopi 3993]
MAIISGVTFLADQPNPHYAPYDIGGGIDWMRQQLTTAAPAHNQQQRNTLQERRTTKMDFTWFKSAGLAAVQNFAHAILGVFGGNAVDVLHVNWVTLCRSGPARRSSQC